MSNRNKTMQPVVTEVNNPAPNVNENNQQNVEENNERGLSTDLLSVVAGKITKIEFNSVESTEKEGQVEALRGFVRSRLLKQFGVNEVRGLEVKGGNLLMNGIGTAMKLPKIIRNDKGQATETLTNYYTRCKPAIAQWLIDSVHNSDITVEMILEIK